MRNRFSRRLIVLSLFTLSGATGAAVYGDEAVGESSWKIVSASEASSDYQARSPLPAWEEPAEPASVPLKSTLVPRSQREPDLAPRPANPSPAPTQPPLAQPAPAASAARPAARPLIPSAQLRAAYQRQSAPNQLTSEQLRAAIAGATTNSQSATQLSMTRRTSAATSPVATGRQGKPFQVVSRDPTITPWLDLFRDEDLSQLPNYFTFVRPQFDQLEINRRNRADLSYLQREVQNVATGVAGPQYGGGALPATGHRPRYMDTAQFYGRWAR